MNEILLHGARGPLLRCRAPEGRRERLRGLIGLERLAPDEAFLVANATSVHTFGMRFPILVVRLDASLRVVDVRRVPPWRLVPPIYGARHVLECNRDADLRVGDVLRVVGSRRRVEEGSATERADEGEDERGSHGERHDDDRRETPGPRRERDGLSSTALRLDDPEELQQQPHR